MRKLVYAIFIILIALLVWAGLALWNPSIAKASDSLLRFVGGSIWFSLLGIGNWIRITASVTNVAFLFYTLIILVVAVFFWAGVRKLWTWGATHRPHLKSPSLSSSGASVDGSGIGASTRGSATPAGATTRPATTTNLESAKKIVATIDEEEKIEA